MKLLVTLLAVATISGRGVSQYIDSHFASSLAEGCPETCSSLFGMLETPDSGEKRQDVVIHQRGEPKSGTSFMSEWSYGSLKRACIFLIDLYGEKACRWQWDHDSLTISITFEPHHERVGQGARCQCDDVDRVSVGFSRKRKHMLPVEDDCPWQHINSVAKQRSPSSAMRDAEPTNFDELRLAMMLSGCSITDTSRQMVIFRDPRPLAVSSYFFQAARWKHPENHSGIDVYVQTMFPIFCQWTAIRYVLFMEIMAPQSSLFWYSDALSDTVGWHKLWFDSIGLQLPRSFVNETAHAAINGESGIKLRKKDPHNGEASMGSSRSYEDELSAETLASFEYHMRRWLPSELLERFGVEPW